MTEPQNHAGLLANANSRLAALESRGAERERENGALRDELRAANARAEEAGVEAAALREQLAEAWRMQEAAGGALHECMRERDEAREQLADAEAHRHADALCIEALSKAHDDVSEQLAAAQAELAKVQGEREGLHDALCDMQRALRAAGVSPDADGVRELHRVATQAAAWHAEDVKVRHRQERRIRELEAARQPAPLPELREAMEEAFALYSDATVSNDPQRRRERRGEALAAANKARALLSLPAPSALAECEDCEQLIIQRDRLEEVIDDVKSTLGIQSEWTNLYGYTEFIDEAQSVVALRMQPYWPLPKGVTPSGETLITVHDNDASAPADGEAPKERVYMQSVWRVHDGCIYRPWRTGVMAELRDDATVAVHHLYPPIPVPMLLQLLGVGPSAPATAPNVARALELLRGVSTKACGQHEVANIREAIAALQSPVAQAAPVDGVTVVPTAKAEFALKAAGMWSDEPTQQAAPREEPPADDCGIKGCPLPRGHEGWCCHAVACWKERQERTTAPAPALARMHALADRWKDEAANHRACMDDSSDVHSHGYHEAYADACLGCAGDLTRALAAGAELPGLPELPEGWEFREEHGDYLQGDGCVVGFYDDGYLGLDGYGVKTLDLFALYAHHLAHASKGGA